jgi:hypothetical protein
MFCCWPWRPSQPQEAASTLGETPPVVDAALLVTLIIPTNPVVFVFFIVLVTFIIQNLFIGRIVIVFLLLRVNKPVSPLDAIPKVGALVHRQMPVTIARYADEHCGTRVLDVKITELIAKLGRKSVIEAHCHDQRIILTTT